MGTIIVGGFLTVSIVLAVRKIVWNKKTGKMLSCGGDCSKCRGCH